MSVSALNGTDRAFVEEDATPTYSVQLQDQDGADLAKAAISTATVRVINVSDGAVIQADTSVLADISTTGLLSTILPATYCTFQDSTQLPKTTETHQLIFTITQTSGLVDVHHLFLVVRRST